MSANVITFAGTPAVRMIDSDRVAIEDGYMFSVYLVGTLGSGEAAEIALTTGASGAHLTYGVHSEKIAVFSIKEGVTSLAAGTAFTAVNRNRNNSRAATTTVKTGVPAGALTYSGGTVIESEQITSAGSNSAAQADHKFLLKNSTTTIFRLVAGAASCDFSLGLTWQEGAR